MMIKFLSVRRRWLALFLSSLFLFQIVLPVTTFGLTAGPTQPEVQSFQPAGTSEMVDLFSGDFSYNIPLFELPGPNGGYPFNLSYQSGIRMDQEASWVGLGWSLNPGAITRQMRGLPDEFKGDDLKTKMSVKPSVTVGLGAGGSVEVFGGDAVSLNLGFSVSHNNYTGLGYSIDGSLGFQRSAESGRTGGIGLGFSLDSKEGINLQPSLSLAGVVGEVGLGASYNSKSGLSSLSMTYDKSFQGEYTHKDNKRTWQTGFSHRASLSVAHPGYTPQISMSMKNINLAAEFKAGGAVWGIFGNLYVRGFYNEQWLANDNKTVSTDAYGYMNYQHASEPTAILDFNREKDGMVTKESPNLGIPSLTYDIYSVTGQGMSAMYRPIRNDYGLIHDQEISSVSDGGSVGVDVGPAATHVGVSLSVNHSKSTSGPWKENNAMLTPAKFQSSTANSLYEPWYFKVHGEPQVLDEPSYSKLGGDKAVRIKLGEDRSNPSAQAALERRDWAGSHPAPDNAAENRERKPRSQVIQSYTNEQLLRDGTDPVLPQFNIQYLNEANANAVLDRESHPPHHIAAYVALTADGLRYNYGLPAYNNRHEEVTFSAQRPDPSLSRVPVGNHGDGDPAFEHTDTDEFLKSVSIPKYAHSHLLTSIVGPDYVDMTNDGVTEDDLGYWVKFTYRKTTSAYKWRDPFSQAHYQEGWKTDPRDDKGSFAYGEKELWFLARAETKSHIAEFLVGNDRLDGKGVLHKLQDSDAETGPATHRLKEIKLYTRAAGASKPIKVVRLVHDQSLCQGLYNAATTGKLTLKEVWFEYGGSSRGSLNPYQFKYEGLNPAYQNLAYDRWGNYKPYHDDNRDFPYVPQDPSQKSQLDAYASAWSLTEIVLPSGGTIKVDYEVDDYAYVQHKQAMQMVEIVDPVGSPTSSVFNLADNARVSGLSDDYVKIRFKLEYPINGSLPGTEKAKEVLKYIDSDRKQLYFKSLVQLRTPSEGFQEYIAGYADIEAEPQVADVFTMGLEGASGESSAPYYYGYFHIKTEPANDHKRHPFSLRAWQHLRTNQPDLANSGRKLKQTDSETERVNQIKSLGSIGSQVRQMFDGFYDFCEDKGWGREVKVGKSWIRLKSPDKVKYGGGLRVRQITMLDNWSDDEEGIYGQVYEYTIEEEGEPISSGVAAYEPIAGGDENPLRYAKRYVQSVPLRADNNLFFEYPVNESYYPGAHVGYRKVTVWSLPSAFAAGKDVRNITLSNQELLFPEGGQIGTSGKTEHEFFTAKDFPVITDETEKVNRAYKLAVPVPLLGSISISRLASSQGYSIITNDMHGRPKMVSNYRQDKSGNVEPEPISWIKYNYLTEEKIYENEKVNVLANTLKENADHTLSAPTPENASLPSVIFGQETEFFSDMRQYEDKTWAGGARVNTDVMYIPIAFVPVPIPIPTVWPSISKTENQLRMAVTNKIIFRSGILKSIEAFDGGSTILTENEKWDKLTGEVIVKKTNNNFDDPVFSYSIPAYTQYAGMGAAYQNIGFVFDISSVIEHPYEAGQYDFYSNAPAGTIYPGDEIILYEVSDESNIPVARAVYMGTNEGDNFLYCSETLQLADYRCMVVRSGFRNQLAVSAGNITALDDPSKKGVPVTYDKTITIIK